jgi:hypothetical protein
MRPKIQDRDGGWANLLRDEMRRVPILLSVLSNDVNLKLPDEFEGSLLPVGGARGSRYRPLDKDALPLAIKRAKMRGGFSY